MSDDVSDDELAKAVKRRRLGILEVLALQESRISRETHGIGELVRSSGTPRSASGCLLPDGTQIAAECLTLEDELADEGRVWSRGISPGSPLRRRGRLRIDDGVGLFFIEDAEADAPARDAVEPADMERDMGASVPFRSLVARSDLFARLLYAAMCNIIWVHETTGQPWSVSWRGAGGVVSRLRGEGCYADWYCGGHEGTVDGQVLAKLKSMGWQLLADLLPETEGF